jgi:hypothetical protein
VEVRRRFTIHRDYLAFQFLEFLVERKVSNTFGYNPTTLVLGTKGRVVTERETSLTSRRSPCGPVTQRWGCERNGAEFLLVFVNIKGRRGLNL